MAKRKPARKVKKSSKRNKDTSEPGIVSRTISPDTDTENKMAVFHIGEEMYAFRLDIIMETLYTYTVSPVAHLPEVYKGVITFQGETLPVVSLRELLHAGETGSPAAVCIIIALNGDRMGFLIDTDIDIVPATTGQRYPLPDCYTLEESEFIEGIFWLDQRFIGILNPRRMMEVLAGWRRSNEKK